MIAWKRSGVSNRDHPVQEDRAWRLVEMAITLHKKWSFPLRVSSVNLTKSAGNCGLCYIYCRVQIHSETRVWHDKNIQSVTFTVHEDLVTLTEEILNGKLHFLWNVVSERFWSVFRILEKNSEVYLRTL